MHRMTQLYKEESQSGAHTKCLVGCCRRIAGSVWLKSKLKQNAKATRQLIPNNTLTQASTSTCRYPTPFLDPSLPSLFFRQGLCYQASSPWLIVLDGVPSWATREVWIGQIGSMCIPWGKLTLLSTSALKGQKLRFVFKHYSWDG